MPLVDFAILTGLAEEFKVLKRIISGFRELSDGGEVWYRTQIASSDRKNSYTVIAAYQNDMGPLEAQALAARVIDRWDPAQIILVGIAGSFREDVKLGDVVVSQQVFYYDPGKATPGGIQYRPQGYPCSTVLIRQAEALTIDHTKSFRAWQRAANASAVRLAKEYTGAGKKQTQRARLELKKHRPNIHFGTVASGSLVIASEKKKKELLALHGKIIGTEMEGAGVLHAAFYQDLPTPAVVIKGISDAADTNKDQEDAKGYWRELAKENPVRLALGLIRRGTIRSLHTDEFDLDPTIGSPALARGMIPDVSAPGVAYLAFPRLVLPKGPLTNVQLQVQAENKDGPLAVSNLVIRYKDRSESLRKVEFVDAAGAHLDEPVSPSPIEVYALVGGVASAVTFTVTTPNSQRQARWTPLL